MSPVFYEQAQLWSPGWGFDDVLGSTFTFSGGPGLTILEPENYRGLNHYQYTILRGLLIIIIVQLAPRPYSNYLGPYISMVIGPWAREDLCRSCVAA